MWQILWVTFLMLSLLLPDLVRPPVPHDLRGQGVQASHGGPTLLGWDAIGLGRSMWSNTGQWDARGNLLWGFRVRLLYLYKEIPPPPNFPPLCWMFSCLCVMLGTAEAILWSWGERGWKWWRIENTWVCDNVVKPPIQPNSRFLMWTSQCLTFKPFWLEFLLCAT